MAFNRSFGLAPLTVGVALSLLSPGAAADEGPAKPTAAQKESARSLMRAGDQNAKAKDFAKALENYQAADELMNVPVTRVAVGRAYEKLGRLVEARDAYLAVQRIPERKREPRPFVRARKEAQQGAARLKEIIPSVTLAFEGLAEGDDPPPIELDGTLVPAAALALPQRANPGDHEFAAVGDDYKGRVAFSLEAKESRLVTLVLTKIAKKPEPAPVVAKPPASDEGLGISPWAWVGWGVGAAGLITGGVTGGLALAEKNELDGLCADDVCPRASSQDAYDRSLLLADISTVGFIVGGVGVAFGTVAFFVFPVSGDESDGEEAQARWRPVLGPGFVGIDGTF